MDKHFEFVIHNILWIFFFEGFFGVYVPLKHIFLSLTSLPSLWLDDRDKEQASGFYVRPPSMEPRREYVTANKTAVDKTKKNNPTLSRVARRKTLNTQVTSIFNSNLEHIVEVDI